MTAAIDLDMLAYDIADMLGRNDYSLDATADDIRPHLEGFLAAVRATTFPVSDEPGDDAARWTPPAADPMTSPRGGQPRYGRVRVFPIYVYAATNLADPECDEMWITDHDKQGEVWARGEAEREAAKDGGTIGRFLRQEALRWRPYAGTPRGARP